MHTGVLETLQEIERELGSKKFRLYALVDEHKQLSTQTLENVPPCTTFHQLLEVVNYYQPHVIHIIAHGRYQSSKGQIALMGEDRKAHWIGDANLSEWLVNNNSLRLVFLQSCESALSNSYEAVSGCAKFLVNNGVSAVIGMQYKIQASAAVLFAKTFYEALKKSLPIDVAVQEARKKMSLAISDNEQSYAFGLPVLYLSQSQPLFVPKILTTHRRRNKHV
jgi:CHAT domain-containing protein